jgi:hypothetical protein
MFGSETLEVLIDLVTVNLMLGIASRRSLEEKGAQNATAAAAAATLRVAGVTPNGCTALRQVSASANSLSQRC